MFLIIKITIFYLSFFPFSFSSKLINRIKRGTIPSSKINKQVRNIHQALENQKLVIEGARNIGCEIPNISAEDLWSGRVRYMFFIYLFNNNFSFRSLHGNKNKRQGKMKGKLAVVK